MESSVSASSIASGVQPMHRYPPGMEYLAQLDQVLIKQETQLLEVLLDYECKNKFRVMNSLGQQVFFAFEESSICQRLCGGADRGFVYHITDNMQQEVFRVRREMRCFAGCSWCACEQCRYYASVEYPNGQVFGYVSNLQYCCSPTFGIFNESKNLIAEIQGPCCMCQGPCCTADIDFPIIDLTNGSEMGKISRQFPGVLAELYTDSDHFRVAFPINMDVQKKALMFAAVFIVDMTLFETQGKKTV